jgi:hypothetical protein
MFKDFRRASYYPIHLDLAKIRGCFATLRLSLLSFICGHLRPSVVPIGYFMVRIHSEYDIWE